MRFCFLYAAIPVISITMSFDVPKHNHAPIEIYGTAGSLLVPDPNRFGGEVRLARTGGEWQPQPHTHGNTEGEGTLMSRISFWCRFWFPTYASDRTVLGQSSCWTPRLY